MRVSGAPQHAQLKRMLGIPPSLTAGGLAPGAVEKGNDSREWTGWVPQQPAA